MYTHSVLYVVFLIFCCSRFYVPAKMAIIPDIVPKENLLMANSLHFVDNKGAVLNLVRGYLATGGRLLIVEYDTDRGNQWVPYPFSFSSWKRLARRAGFTQTELMATHPSHFLGGFYAALSH